MKPICNRVHVSVPATSANLGSGFDTVGLALDYHDELVFTLNEDPSDGVAHVIIHGEGEDTLPRDETHLVVSTFRRACATFGLGNLGFTLEATNNIPQARGMGSSAEAIVAGIAAAAAFAQDGELNRAAIFDMAAHFEGHPDNVAPAVFGGLTVSWDFEMPEGVGVSDSAGKNADRVQLTFPQDENASADRFIPVWKKALTAEESHADQAEKKGDTFQWKDGGSVEYNGRTWLVGTYEDNSGISTMLFTDVEPGSVYVLISNFDQHKKEAEALLNSIEFPDDMEEAVSEAREVEISSIEIK